MSRTQEALALMREQGMSANRAAKTIGVSVSAVLAGAKRERKKIGLAPCPCCGQVVRAGFEVRTRQELATALTWLDTQAEQQPDPVGKKWIAAIAKGMRTLGG